MKADTPRQIRAGRTYRLGVVGVFVALGSVAQGAAVADEAPVEAMALRAFAPDFFIAFAPQSALDMVNQTPGFAIKEGDGKRGMGSGGANVLVNRHRITSKSISARETLNRISADQVVRIEILDATQLGLPGVSGQVVNVVTRPTAMTGRWEWSPEADEGAGAELERGRLLVSGAAGDWSYNLGLSSYAFSGRSVGPETLYDGAGQVLELRREKERWSGHRHEISGTLSHETLSGDLSNLGLVLAASDDDRREESLRASLTSPDRLRTYAYTSDGNSLKLSGDYEFAVGGGRLKLIGLRSSASSEPVTETGERVVGAAPDSGARVKVDRATSESILRGEYSWAGGGDWQMALEGAVNTLDTATSLASLTNGLFVDQPLSGGASHVEEKRTEATLVHGRQLAGGVFMQASVAAEYSEIAQSGPAGRVRDFVRPKGFIAVSWAPVTDWNASVKLERSVGQLDFGDFVSSVNLADESGQLKSGNPTIVPEQSWDVALEANGELIGLGPVRMKVFGRQIEDLNGPVLFARTVDANGAVSISEGPGNLDGAMAYGLDVSGTLPMADMGLPGGKLDWTASLRDSRLNDPVTGMERPLSGSRLSYYEVRFRQDLPGTPWAWGLGYETARDAAGYGVTQVTYRSDAPGRVGAFVQHKNIAGMNAKLSLSNLADTSENFTRVIHAGSAADPVAYVEDRQRKQGLHVGLNLSGSF